MHIFVTQTALCYVSGHDSLACTAALEKHRGLRVFQDKKLTSRAWAWVVGGNGLHLGLCVYKVSALLGFTRAEIVFT